MTKKESTIDAGSLPSVIAALLLDNVTRLDKTVGDVTDLVVGKGQPSREMIVTLQSFDRLKQEFEALGLALSRYVEGTAESESDTDRSALLEQHVVDGIPVGDLKERFLSRLKQGMAEIILPQISDQELAFVGID